MPTKHFHFQLLNLGHALDHYFILIFPAAILTLQQEWDIPYADLMKYGSVAVLAYGVGSLPAGWLGDRWSQKGMMNVYFYGMGLSAIAAAASQTPVQLAIAVTAIGLFAAIYHPVGIALVYHTTEKTGRAIAVNGVVGNLGLACAVGVTVFLSQTLSWQAAFLLPGIVCLLIGVAYTWVSNIFDRMPECVVELQPPFHGSVNRVRLFASIAVIACFGGLVFQSVTTALPKMVESSLTMSLTLIGLLSTVMFILASIGQLVIGELLDRVPAKMLLLLVTAVQALFLVLASLTNGWVLVLVLTGLLFSTFSQIPINDWLIGKHATDQWRSRLYAMKYALSSSTGPVAYWLIAVIYGGTAEFILLYWVLAVTMLLSVGAVLLIPADRKRGTDIHVKVPLRTERCQPHMDS